MKPIASISRTQAILQDHALHAKKKFGQNFIIEPRMIERIIGQAQLDQKSGVIEVGPGIGALTEGLTQAAGQVRCYEIDPDMVAVLIQELGNQPNLEIIAGDFLKVDLAQELRFFHTDEIQVVANLPYYITSKLLEKIALEGEGIQAAIVMVQKDVAYKMAVSEDLRDRLPLTLLLKCLGDVKILFDVPRTVFWPAPHVDSAILSITFDATSRIIDRKGFYHFLQTAFKARRKTLVNNLRDLSFQMPVSVFLASRGLPAATRAEELSLDDLMDLFDQCTHSF